MAGLGNDVVAGGMRCYPGESGLQIRDADGTPGCLIFASHHLIVFVELGDVGRPALSLIFFQLFVIWNAAREQTVAKEALTMDELEFAVGLCQGGAECTGWFA